MEDFADLGAVEQGRETLGDALAVVVRRRGDLVGAQGAVGGEGHEVGEGAADVDADTDHDCGSCSGCLATVGAGGRSARSFARNAFVAASSITGGSPAATTP